MSGSYALQQEAIPLQGKIKLLINDDLKRILRSELLPVAGVKANLQERIMNRLNDYVKANNVQAFNKLRFRIHDPRSEREPPNLATSSITPPAYNQPYYNSSSSPVNAQQPYAMGAGYRPPAPQPAARRSTFFPNRVNFKESPFFEVQGNVTATTELQKNEQTRQSVTLKIDPSPSFFENPSLRIMLFCAGDNPTGYGNAVDIEFPAQLEIKVNGAEVKHNFKGMKKKPGTTKPADITSLISRNQQSFISIMYALTTKRYQIVACLVKARSVDELVEKIKRGRVISKDTVLREMRDKAADPDIVATSTVMSLKDPVAGTRISTPCRSNVCKHNQCFDAAWFLQLQEQAPTWTCPICNKVVSFGGLAIDEYVQEILQNTSSSTDQVTIEPDGAWHQGSTSSNVKKGNAAPSPDSADDDDDVVEITDHRVTNIKAEAGNTPTSFPFSTRTPPASSREASINGSASHAPRGTKRKPEIVVISDDDDDEPVRPPKRYQQAFPPTTTNTAPPVPPPVPAQQHVPNGYRQALPIQNQRPNSYRSVSELLQEQNSVPPVQPFHLPAVNSAQRPSLSNPITSNGVPLGHHQGQPIMRGPGNYGGYIGPGNGSSPPI